jgi:hypothetical protein
MLPTFNMQGPEWMHFYFHADKKDQGFFSLIPVNLTFVTY